jgi:DNA-directed RNA polymerase subunit RPC12/RpoP
MKTQKADVKSCPACPYGPPAWQYECQECGHKFQMPAPKGPTEAKSRACPECKSKNIKRLDIVKSEACPPGG